MFVKINRVLTLLCTVYDADLRVKNYLRLGKVKQSSGSGQSQNAWVESIASTERDLSVLRGGSCDHGTRYNGLGSVGNGRGGCRHVSDRFSRE